MVHFFAARKPGNVNIDDVQVGDLIRIELDPLKTDWREKNYLIVITSISKIERAHIINGLNVKDNKPFNLLYSPWSMELFLEARCDNP